MLKIFSKLNVVTAMPLIILLDSNHSFSGFAITPCLRALVAWSLTMETIKTWSGGLEPLADRHLADRFYVDGHSSGSPDIS